LRVAAQINRVVIWLKHVTKMQAMDLKVLSVIRRLRRTTREKRA
jgi:hypothetical protein